MKMIIMLMVLSASISPLGAHYQIPETIKETIARCSIGPNDDLVAMAEDKLTVRKFAHDSWRQFLPHLAEMDSHSQAVLVQAATDRLEGHEYISFLAQSLGLLAKVHLSPLVGDLLLGPSSSGKEGFLEVNYDNPELAAALREVLPTITADPDRKAFIERVLSGKAKVEHLKWANDMGIEPLRAVTSTPRSESRRPTSSHPISAEPVANAFGNIWSWVVGAGVLLLVVFFVFKSKSAGGHR